MKRLSTLLCLLLVVLIHKAGAQFPADTANYAESEIVPYFLPDPLLLPNGERIKTKEEWTRFQRAYIYHLFETYVYGRYPTKEIKVSSRIREQGDALNGTAKRKQIRLFLNPQDSTVFVDVLMYLPKSARGPVPVFLALNFQGNPSTQSDPEILFPVQKEGQKDKFFKDSIRGVASSRWPVEEIVENGFGIVTAFYEDLEVDHKDGWKNGIRTTLQEELDIRPEEWSAIGAWAWGLSRIMDYLEQDNEVNAQEVAVVGHSRLGKTALWAGASDKRFKIVISNDSGEGGAALSRRWFGETVKRINTVFPHWFVARYKNYNDDVFGLPVDQHELLSLIAPRPLYVASATDDLWADPLGQFLSAWHAEVVYQLFDEQGLGTGVMPPDDTPIGHTIRFHNRTGKHDITFYDWQQYIKFAREVW